MTGISDCRWNARGPKGKAGGHLGRRGNRAGGGPGLAVSIWLLSRFDAAVSEQPAAERV